ncbi:MAG: hypothetical protein MK364_15770, partial [Pirellulales bacterium]|nr:hypothetical protein [Pirellulales bacterium]
MIISERFQQDSRWALSRRRVVSTVLGLPWALCRELSSAPQSAKPGVPWLVDVQRAPATLPDKTPRLPALLVDRQGK